MELQTKPRGAIARFRLRTGLPVSYGVDDQLIAAIDKTLDRWIRPTPTELQASQSDPPSEEALTTLTANLRVELPALLAVRDVESAGRGFDKENRPLIAFDRRYFQKHARRVYDPTSLMPYDSIVSSPFNDQVSFASRWDELERAYLIDPEAAYSPTSFGVFQISGLNAKRMGFGSAGEYARFVSQSELNQYAALFLFGSSSPAVAALKARDWDGFTRAYQGMKNPRYTALLAQAYEREAAMVHKHPPWEAIDLSLHRSDR
jgi:N-acetylmuramidase